MMLLQSSNSYAYGFSRSRFRCTHFRLPSGIPEVGKLTEGLKTSVEAAGVEANVLSATFGEAAPLLGEIDVAPNVSTCQRAQNEIFVSVIVSKNFAGLRPLPCHACQMTIDNEGGIAGQS